MPCPYSSEGACNTDSRATCIKTSERTTPYKIENSIPCSHQYYSRKLIHEEDTHNQLGEDRQTYHVSDVRAEEGRDDKRDGGGRIERRGLDDGLQEATVHHEVEPCARMPLPMPLHELVRPQEPPHDEHWLGMMLDQPAEQGMLELRRLEEETERTCRQHVREEREAEEDEGQDETTQASDGYGTVTADWPWCAHQQGVPMPR